MTTNPLDDIINDLASSALNLHHSKTDSTPLTRQIVSLVAVPAAGKTTLARYLCSAVNKRCEELMAEKHQQQQHTSSNDEQPFQYQPLVALLPMDGYHLMRHSLSNRALDQKSLPPNCIPQTSSPSESSSDSTSQQPTVFTSPTYIPSQQQLRRNFDWELKSPFDNSSYNSETNSVDDQFYAIADPNSTSQGGFQYQTWPGKTAAFAHRGAPYTFDPFLLAYALSNIKHCNPTNQIWPGWDHAKKDPSYDELIQIPPSTTLIIIEGLYLLLDVEPWNGLLCGSTYSDILYHPDNQDPKSKQSSPSTTENHEKQIEKQSLIDYGIFLDCDEQTTLDRGSVRNFKAGITDTLEESIERWKNNDIKNGRFLVSHLVQDKIKYRLTQDDIKGIDML